MAIVLATIAWLAVGIVAALLALLLVPADYAISAGTSAGVHLRVRWLFGMVRFAYDSSARTHSVEEPPHRRGESSDGGRIARRLLAVEGLIARSARLLAELVRSLGWRRGRVALRVGLDDPADTGELCALVWPALVLLPGRSGLRVEFQPDFAGASFDAQAEGSGRFVPVLAVAALGRFAVSRPGRRALGVMLWNRGR